jgi:hypothetical protein
MTNIDGVAGKRVSDDALVESYRRTGNVHKTGREVGLAGGTVHERLVRLGIERSANPFVDAERDRLRAEYRIFSESGKLDALAQSMGRSKTTICTEAKKLGLTQRAGQRRLWHGKWKYMSESAAAALFDHFKASSLGLGRYCKEYALDDLGFSRTMQQFFPDEWDHTIEAKAPRQTKYRYGRAFEYRVRDDMRKLGYFVLRSPRSGSPIDLVAIRRGEVVFIQCKTGGVLGPAEWNEFYNLSVSVGALPLMAERSGFRGVTYWRLIGTKDGTKKPQPKELFVLPRTEVEVGEPALPEKAGSAS